MARDTIHKRCSQYITVNTFYRMHTIFPENAPSDLGTRNLLLCYHDGGELSGYGEMHCNTVYSAGVDAVRLKAHFTLSGQISICKMAKI